MTHTGFGHGREQLFRTMRAGPVWAIGVGLTVLACGGEAQRNAPRPGPATATAGAAAMHEPPAAGSFAGVPGSGAPGGSGSGDPETGGDASDGGTSGPGAGAGGADSTRGMGGVDSTSGTGGMGGETGAAEDPSSAGSGGETSHLPCNPIVFEDAAFEAAVRASVGKGPGALSAVDVEALTFLTATGVTSLRGAECLTNLTSLDIAGPPLGRVSDLSPLATLSKLEELNLDRNPLASLSPLGELPSLELLFMSHVPTPLDLTPLRTAPALELLYLEGDTVLDLAPLGEVRTLKTLHLTYGTLLEPAGTSKLTSLVDLSAPGVFADAAPFSSLTKLKKLRLGEKPLANLDALSSLSELGFLGVDNADIADIAPLARLKNLRNLQARGNRIRDLAPLRELPLDHVVLIDNRITDTAPLAQNLALVAGDFVWLQGNPFPCADEAANLSALRGRGVGVNSDCPN